MPKSKRNRVVSLTRTKAGGKKRKNALVDNVQGLCDQFETIYVFSCHNLRTNPLKRLRVENSDCRFLYGKNKVVRLALGKSREDAYLPGLDTLGETLRGDVGLCFTNREPKDFEEKISAFRESAFARAGILAPSDVKVKKGPISGQPSSMFEPLRKLLLPVKLNKGVIELEEDFFICKKGETLTPEQAQALKVFDKKLVDFSVHLLYRFNNGQLTKLSVNEDNDDANSNSGESDMEDF